MNKTVLITGASRGIGLALAKCFLKNNYNVIGTSTTGKIKSFEHPNFKNLKLELSDEKDINNIAQFLKNNNIEISILINNSGIGPDLDTLKPDIESFKKTFDINVIGTVFLTELLEPFIKMNGKIINISSKMGSIEFCALTDSTAYRMSKTALNMYTKILSNRLINKQSVASVHPGWVQTDISPNSSINGRLLADDSGLKIFNFILSDFKTGIFWNIETESEIDW
ncbi:NAD(P)-dependent dehydrogenase, short-chain alcohol dehydrogenase family [Flavobacterium resistens]|uniref:NAD(P)-dependent dehydrogenase, short-chain alcohol dehydrogenase family n=1 Tax=Flavobacterium resistens TaxID=443612 RepID=A0A521F6M1_9FLAO|nr:SDR family NAD(P)-dependent oxidoreductase [Flavobacterium resistens]MRX70140.1 SDR family NAD(P)-dependent oxidoreductase [Flavobacterium resistens]SMO91858.1 NAD(P)-dependent dehydrogenase, short-chain alcohol dehydrogenase family [Flavobacterium resistens]